MKNPKEVHMKNAHPFRIRFTRISIEVIVALLLCLWIYTGINKLMDYSNFRTQLGRSPFIQPMASLIAVMLPAGELLLAAMLIFGKTRKLGLYLSFGLMLLFTGYIWIMLHYAYDLPCSCGGVLAKLSWSDHLLFNSLYTLTALMGVLLAEAVPVIYQAKSGEIVANSPK